MKTQREIMEQREKNKCILMDEIEKCSGERMNLENAQRLSAYMGAYKALCVADGESYGEAYGVQRGAVETPAPTPELDGDTEFERVIMTIPADAAHMVKLTHVFNKHLEDLKFANARAYNSIMDQLREVAKS